MLVQVFGLIHVTCIRKVFFYDLRIWAIIPVAIFAWHHSIYPLWNAKKISDKLPTIYCKCQREICNRHWWDKRSWKMFSSSSKIVLLHFLTLKNGTVIGSRNWYKLFQTRYLDLDLLKPMFTFLNIFVLPSRTMFCISGVEVCPIVVWVQAWIWGS